MFSQPIRTHHNSLKKHQIIKLLIGIKNSLLTSIVNKYIYFLKFVTDYFGKAGLKDRDYILEVNEESIDGLEHDAIVNKIIAFPTHVEFLVVADLNAYLNKQVK